MKLIMSLENTAHPAILDIDDINRASWQCLYPDMLAPRDLGSIALVGLHDPISRAKEMGHRNTQATSRHSFCFRDNEHFETSTSAITKTIE